MWENSDASANADDTADDLPTPRCRPGRNARATFKTQWIRVLDEIVSVDEMRYDAGSTRASDNAFQKRLSDRGRGSEDYR